MQIEMLGWVATHSGVGVRYGTMEAMITSTEHAAEEILSDVIHVKYIQCQTFDSSK